MGIGNFSICSHLELGSVFTCIGFIESRFNSHPEVGYQNLFNNHN